MIIVTSYAGENLEIRFLTIQHVVQFSLCTKNRADRLNGFQNRAFVKIVFTLLNHKNSSPTIFERVSVSKIDCQIITFYQALSIEPNARLSYSYKVS